MMDTKKVLTICGIITVVFILLDLFFVHHHVKYWWHGFIGFDTIYGFIGCVAIIVISKKLGKLFIQRDEEFYGGGED
ncbi:MAG: hypothetical protein PWQ67_2258 [Clostridia bacterium]|jgi:hypothetical protein|nr:hypothetical protein [Clostridia bacterium]MDN5323804.1 hypothetical protein [Clostridia bacterium]